ncbi:MAG TPA: TetR/AcrR family transcriptional regulator [Ilumatobacteraceae bacterium]|nr:TetR/AcrR family transcriptional regulator [Ilumatobacteraceae bacterium]
MTVTSPRRRGPGRPKGGQVVADRTQLLAAAADVIRTHGPDATMDDIAAGASVTKPILYRTIGDKAALVAALSESLIDQIDRSVSTATGSATDPVASFEAAIRGYVLAVEADRNLFLFVNSSPPGTEPFRRLVDRSAASMITAFADARTAVGLDPRGATTWSWAIVGALQVVTTMWLRDDAADLDALVRDISQLLWSGLGPTLAGDRPG